MSVCVCGHDRGMHHGPGGRCAEYTELCPCPWYLQSQLDDGAHRAQMRQFVAAHQSVLWWELVARILPIPPFRARAERAVTRMEQQAAWFRQNREGRG